MADQAATSLSGMNALHAKVAQIFMAVLKRYEDRLDLGTNMVLKALEDGTVEHEVLSELFKDDILPSPAMLSAVTKFLKDNEVMFDKGITEELSSQQRALQEKAKNRPNLAQLSIVPRVLNG